MQCPTTADLLRCVSGEAGPDEAAAIHGHLADCPACADAIAALRQTWAALDAWQPETTGADISGRVLRAVEIEAATPKRHYWRWPALMRVAASVAIATGLGVGAGRLVSGSRASDGAIAMADRTGHDFLDTLTSAFAATDSATGISLHFEQGSDQEGR